MRFVMLNPGVHFNQIVSKSRAVILAGGTMQPTSHFVQQLFTKVPKNKLKVLACDHVVPSDQVLAVTFSCGPSKQLFDFTFKNRRNPAMIKDLGRTLTNICNVVKGGMVLFFPSFKYLGFVLEMWKTVGIFGQINKKKVRFCLSSLSRVFGSTTLSG